MVIVTAYLAIETDFKITLASQALSISMLLVHCWFLHFATLSELPFYFL